MGQPAVRHSDNVAQPAELAMEEHGFDCWSPSPRSNFRMRINMKRKNPCAKEA